jgi:hypothetical protein
VTGGPIRGSWWGHPLGSLIFNLASELEETGEVLSVKLVAGKVALVHRSLWPALLRVVTDATWRRERSSGLSPAARRLLAAVTEAGSLRRDELGAGAKGAQKELEKRLLLHVGQVHTARGSHVTVLTSWEAWASPAVRRAAKALSVEEALARMTRACDGFPG